MRYKLLFLLLLNLEGISEKRDSQRVSGDSALPARDSGDATWGAILRFLSLPFLVKFSDSFYQGISFGLLPIDSTKVAIDKRFKKTLKEVPGLAYTSTKPVDKKHKKQVKRFLHIESDRTPEKEALLALVKPKRDASQMYIYRKQGRDIIKVGG